MSRPTAEDRAARSQGWRADLRRLLWPHVLKILFATVVIVGMSAWSFLRALIAVPHAQAALQSRVMTVDSMARQTAREVSEIGEAFWIQIAMDCLARPQTDSVMVLLRLPCGKAYFRSGIRTRDGFTAR